MKLRTLFLSVSLIVIQVTFAVSYHVKVTGSSSGNGSNSSAWDLQTALDHPSKVKPGDTIWVHEGLYKGVYESTLSGSSKAPIVVRVVPGEKAIIDGKNPGTGHGCLSIMGQYTYFWGFEITNTHGVRVAGGAEMDIKDGVYIEGPYNKLINCIIHNNGNDGVGFWTPAIDSEIYGCIIYNNGYRDEDRGHGHGIYSQNSSGTKLIRDNILFNSFGLGIQIYTEGGSIKGYHIEGNILFNSGLPSDDFLERQILVGGKQPADRILIKSNYFYNRPNYSSKASLQLGYNATNINAEVVNNYLVNGSFYVIKGWNSVKFTGNTLAFYSATKQLISFDDFKTIQSPTFNNNKYYFGQLDKRTFPDWKSFSGQDNNSTYSATAPTTTHMVLQKNQYEPGRAHLVVYNWGKQTSVGVDLTGIVDLGGDYKIWDVSNFKGGPIATGKYAGGNVSVSMQLTKVELPYGDLPNDGRFIHPAPDFAAFLIESKPKTQPTLPTDVVEVEVPLRILKYYPNPTVDIVAIDFFSPDRKPVSIEVIDTIGNVVSSEFVAPVEGMNNHVLNLAPYPSGFYIITVTNENGRDTCKILKKNHVFKTDAQTELQEGDDYLSMQ